MTKYKLLIVDTETDKVMQEIVSSSIVYHCFMHDKDGDASTGSGIVHSGVTSNLLGVLVTSLSYTKNEIDKIIEGQLS